MKHRKAKKILLALLALIDPSTAIPYTPSSVFLSPQHNNSLAYILRPSSTGETEFVSLNLSSSIDAEDLSYQTLLKSTPFYSSDQNSSFVSAIDDQGLITVYSGNCHSASDNPVLWQFHPNNKSPIGNGTWDRLPVIASGAKTAPNYLAAGFMYSSSRNENESSMYAFGGMCPFENSTDETWISAANYSQSTVVLGPSPYYNTKFTAATTGKRAPPVAEAGMAVVPLQPTYASGSTGKQQDFLFIGGHTRQAFLNMSQLAVFSLPQQSWSFVSAISDSTPKAELTVRDTVSIEPRSGHTAVLSEDGTKVFVFGGWVGDMSVPAEPQFAVLDLAEGFGGATEWIWTAPSFEGLGIDEGAGIFGHGAAMLPGGVMMISGGYNIQKPSSKRALTTAQSNSRVYLYNVTSSSWVTSYSNPATSSPKASASSSPSKLSSSQKAGLGVGLGIGCPAAIAIVLCGWNYHRKRRVKGKRDSQLRELALGAERAHFWGRDCPTQASSIRTSGMSEKRTLPNWKDQGEGTAERTGLLMDPTSLTKNNRPPVVPPVNNRPYSYRNSEYRRSDATGDIHPIDEREEDEAMLREHLTATIPAGTGPTAKTTENEDPFSDTPYATPRSTIFGVGLGPFYSRRKNIESLDAESQTKSEKTATNLSENSALSFVSSQPVGKVNQARAMLVDRPMSWGSGRQSLEYLAAGSTHSDPDGVAPSDKSVSADSYSTAQTNLSHRQSENESLLFESIDSTTAPPSPSKLPRESKTKASDWVMSTMRRALTMSRRSPDSQLYSGANTTSTAHRASGIDRRSTLLGTSQQSTSSGPSTPRRAVSASAELFRRKQGAKDWNARKRVSDDVFNTARSTRDDLFVGAPGYLGDEAGFGDDEEDVYDWDLEGAAEGRRVQTTFTVPREKLRVVNATAGDIDNMSERSVSWGTGNRRVST
ncbi:uncharacterized protein N7479_006868 [Penicillium vulpinum]|uniref:Galactose oxidase/kelch, beta-propeller n=1 Tax=Penicillium vulpinum TaxID=29845 RepID=A0A1V6S3B2_9EURO|nr:uncharacterized protein N7479_006868 [Penicillium vulpinum]KAJ5959718.1 hypothetical protein N7479_006868 [Penicillium vulpinum]OQE08358.1 hypothetical protein PENVUL_c010G07289 [Penicillium vulpinum]